MNTGRQIFLDKYVARPLAIVLNVFVRILGKILRLDHDLSKEFQRITICKFKGMGSILQATPLLKSLRKRYPQAQITFVSTKGNRAILEMIEEIDELVLLDDSSFFQFAKSNLKSLFHFWKNQQDLYIDLEIYSDFSTLFTTFTLSRNRFGFYLRSSTYRLGTYTHMMFFNPRVPISKVYLQFAGLLGASIVEPLAKLGGQLERKKSIVVNVNASDLRLERRWGKTNFASLIQRITTNFPEHKIQLIGGPDERAYTEEVWHQVNQDKVDLLAGKTSISELVETIARAELMITNDTGPMHIAFCSTTPTVCLFGPCSPEQYGMNDSAVVIYKKAYCSPCVHDFEIPPCKGHNICMQLITVDEVYKKVEMMLKDNNTSITSPQNEVVYKHHDNTVGQVTR